MNSHENAKLGAELAATNPDSDSLVVKTFEKVKRISFDVNIEAFNAVRLIKLP